MPNLFDNLPEAVRQEIFEPLLQNADITIERITSQGQATPPGEWLEDARHEWVSLLQGAAELSFSDGRSFKMRPGDHVHIPSHTRHRVEWTDPAQPSVWLAVYYGTPPSAQAV